MRNRQARLNIRLLGSPESSVEDVPLNLNHLKSRALLFYLALTGRAQTRDHLASLLWGESGQSEAYHSLRSSLYHLRKALLALQADEVLISEGELLSLQPNAYVCDVIEFRRLSAEKQENALRRAVACYQGPLLQGFTLPDAPSFDDWVQEEDMRLHREYVDALQQLVAWSESREEWGIAIGYVQQMLQVNPLDEAAQQRLIRYYLRQGQIGLALRQYRQFENGLGQELGIAPSPETQELLYDVLRQQRKSIAAASSARAPLVRSHILPFIGRQDLLDELSMISQQSQTRHGTTVLLQGEGGIGKSRLIDELASQLIA